MTTTATIAGKPNRQEIAGRTISEGRRLSTLLQNAAPVFQTMRRISILRRVVCDNIVAGYQIRWHSRRQSAEFRTTMKRCEYRSGRSRLVAIHTILIDRHPSGRNERTNCSRRRSAAPRSGRHRKPGISQHISSAIRDMGCQADLGSFPATIFHRSDRELRHRHTIMVRYRSP